MFLLKKKPVTKKETKETEDKRIQEAERRLGSLEVRVDVLERRPN